MSALTYLTDNLKNKETIRDKVIEFHKAFGQAIGNCPEVPDAVTVQLRLHLICEEFLELLEASGVEYYGDDDLRAAIDNAQFQIDLPKFADALCDLDYVVEGSRLAFGINGEPILDAVHNANMAKLGGGKREDGKVMKPADWKPPDIEGELVKQGWKK